MRLKNVGRSLMYAGAIAIMIVGFQNCGEGFKQGSDSAGSLGSDEWIALNNQATGIINMRCAGCHNGSVSSTAPNLTDTMEMIATGALVKGNPGASAMYVAMADGGMPKGGPPMPGGEINVIALWIQHMP